jgi:glyoxylase-like metal-dependent hydrolase (beta-lactamase superfamily II)
MQVFERGWLSSNNVLFRDGDGATIVDTGYCIHANQTVALVRRFLGASDARLTRIINTHLHSDHCGGNAALQAQFASARTWIPAAEADAVAHWDGDRLSYRATGQQCPRFTFDATLQDGDRIRLGVLDWQVHAAPGHDPHALLLFQPEHRLLISADALWEDGFGVIFPELDGEPGFSPALAALQLIERLRPAAVIPGHGRPFTDVAAALSRAYSRHEYLAADPRRNAHHAMRVLVKFKLLEAQRIETEALRRWFAQLPLLQRLQRRFFADRAPDELLRETLQRLTAARACAEERGWVVNRD